MRVGTHSWALSSSVALVLCVFGAAAPGVADTVHNNIVAKTAFLSAAAGQPAADVDGDTIPDDIELVVCGTATCATGREDSDADGIADWVEFHACGSAECASPIADSDRDGVPDFVELIVCGSTVCVTADVDVDADGAPDWTEVVICGTTRCATGNEDLDSNGIADDVELQAYASYIRELAAAGAGWLPAALVFAALALIGSAAAFCIREGRRRERRKIAAAGASHLSDEVLR